MKKYVLKESDLIAACERSDRGEPEPPLSPAHGSRCRRCGRMLSPDGTCPAYGCLDKVEAQWQDLTLEQAKAFEYLWNGTTQSARDMVPEHIRRKVESVLNHELSIN